MLSFGKKLSYLECNSSQSLRDFLMLISPLQASQIRKELKRLYENGVSKSDHFLLSKIIKLITYANNSASLHSELIVATRLLQGTEDYERDLHARRIIVRDLKCDQIKWPTMNILVTSTGQAGSKTTNRFLCIYLEGRPGRLDEPGIGNLGGYSPRLAENLYSNSLHRRIFTVHCPAWPDLIYNVAKSKTKTVFLKRNIFDLLKSYATLQQNPYLPDSEGLLTQKFHRAKLMNYAPFCYPEDTEDIESIKWRSILIHGYILVDMIATWVHAKKYINFRIFDLKEQQDDEKRYFKDVLESLGIPFNEKRFELSYSHLKDQKENNPGSLALEPEGKKRIPDFEFSQSQKDVVRTLYEAYPDIDFSIVDDGL